MNEEKNNTKPDFMWGLLVMFWTITSFLAIYSFKGFFRKKTWTNGFLKFWGSYFVVAVLIVFARRWNIPVILDHAGSLVSYPHVGRWVYLHLSRLWQLAIIFFGPFLTYTFGLGVFDLWKNKEPQTAIDHLGLKTSTGLAPKVTKVIELPNYQKKILVQAAGIDVDAMKSKRGALQSGLNAIVQDVRVSPTNRQVFEILVSDKELPTLVPFGQMATQLTTPYSFLVGQSMDSFIVASLIELHHLIVAGATGGGKSYFFKQALVGLLKSSSRIQLYLLDLKRGVEMKAFEPLNNVRIAKDEFQAIAALKAVVAEMDRRFEFLEKHKLTEIDPERDKMDRIVVGIDEASVLFTVEKGSKATKENAQSARELTDKIAKLGRAAGISVILATQKVVKETIDTRVQTNINARMCFRVNTVASSMTVLGNKSAAELPEIRGRGIWSVGSRDIVVQVPKLSNEELAEEIAALTNKFNGDESPLFQTMLQVEKSVQTTKSRYQRKTETEANESEAEV
jgi:hypothetical protein